MLRIAFISHGHPTLSKGGTEVASWSLFDKLRQEGHDCLYIARTEKKHHASSTLASISHDEMLMYSPTTNQLDQSSPVNDHFKDLVELLKKFKPDIIHIHHYLNIGIELFPILKNSCPTSKLVFTMHEFLGICAHHGQMVKPGSLRLCHEESYVSCSRCFSGNTSQSFFSRKRYFQDCFSAIDQFVSPSAFLASKYIEWGLEKSKVKVIENVLDLPAKQPPRNLEGEYRGNFVFLGKASRFKGLDFLLDALLDLPEDIKKNITVTIYADKLVRVLSHDLKYLVEKTRDFVKYMGPYDREDLPQILADTDWLIIPSVWWENSPVVIQEAAAVGRPVLASNIGGMKEKVEGKLGMTFEVCNKKSLQETLIKAMNPDCFDEWHAKLCIHDSLMEHISLYENLLQSNELTFSVNS